MNKRRILLGSLSLVAVLTVAGCGFVPQAATPTPPTAEAIELKLDEIGLPTQGPSVTPSATTEPSKTPTITPTSEIPWFGWPTPVFEDPTTPEPYPANPVDLPDGYETYLLLGSDKLPHRTSANTDAIMIVVVDTDSLAASVMSIPRDLLVFIPGHGMGRINTAYPIGGEQMAADTIKYNFGVPVAGVIHLKMAGFVRYIDNIGGIEVHTTESVYDTCSGGIVLNWLADADVHMSGQRALCYARARANSSDFDRMRRQQEVVRAALVKSIQQFGIAPVETVEDIVEAYQSSLETDLSVLQLTRLARLAYHANQSETISYSVLQSPDVQIWRRPSNNAFLLVPTIDLELWLGNRLP